MFLGRIFTKNAKNDSKHFLKRQNRSKNKIRKITVKSRNDVKSACFLHVSCYISAIFEDIDLKFCTHIHETLPSNILFGFVKKKHILRGTILKRRKMLKFLEILGPSNICYGFLKILVLRGKILKKKKNAENLEILGNFQIFENPRSQFCSPTNSTSFHIRKLIVALKLHPWRRFP